MTTYDSDMQEHDLHILRHVVEEFDGRMALDSAVIQSGRLPVGTPVELLSWHREHARRRFLHTTKGRWRMVQQFDLIIVGAGSGNTIPGPDHVGKRKSIVWPVLSTAR